LKALSYHHEPQSIVDRVCALFCSILSHTAKRRRKKSLRLVFVCTSPLCACVYVYVNNMNGDDPPPAVATFSSGSSGDATADPATKNRSRRIRRRSFQFCRSFSERWRGWPAGRKVETVWTKLRQLTLQGKKKLPLVPFSNYTDDSIRLMVAKFETSNDQLKVQRKQHNKVKSSQWSVF